MHTHMTSFSQENGEFSNSLLIHFKSLSYSILPLSTKILKMLLTIVLSMAKTYEFDFIDHEINFSYRKYLLLLLFQSKK